MKVENLSLRWDKIVRYKFKLKREFMKFMKFMNKFKYQNEINQLTKDHGTFVSALIVKHEVKKELALTACRFYTYFKRHIHY